MSAMNDLGWAGLDRLLTAAGAVENNAQLPLDCMHIHLYQRLTSDCSLCSKAKVSDSKSRQKARHLRPFVWCRWWWWWCCWRDHIEATANSRFMASESLEMQFPEEVAKGET